MAVILVSGLLFDSVASAQFPNQQPTGVTVQLPSTRIFSLNTVVSVPDGGSTYMGGVSRTGRTSISRGVPGLSSVPGANRLFRNRGIGQDISTGGASASVNVIIQDELEEQVMAQARQMMAARESLDPNGSYAVQAQADYISQHVARSPQSSRVQYNAYASPYQQPSPYQQRGVANSPSSQGLYDSPADGNSVQFQPRDTPAWDEEALYGPADYGSADYGSADRDPPAYPSSAYGSTTYNSATYNQPRVNPATGYAEWQPSNQNSVQPYEPEVPSVEVPSNGPGTTSRDELPPAFVPRSFNGTRFNRRN